MNCIVVTGATGMLGAALIRAAIQHGTKKIYAVVRPGTKKLYRLPTHPSVVPIVCGVEELSALPEMIADKCDVFYHFAWSLTGAHRNEDITEQGRNVVYTLEAIQAAAKLGCKKFVGAGSQAEYGVIDRETIGPETPVNPIQPYGIAKYAAGQLALASAKLLQIHCVWVRIFSVYGIYDKPTTMICASLRKLLRGEQTAFTPATQHWDYLFSEDAGEAFWLIGMNGKDQSIYCLGSGKALPLYQYIEQMRNIVCPGRDMGIGKLPFPAKGIKRLCADISTLQQDTGFVPKTTFSDGIRLTLEYLQKELSIEMNRSE
ncbi:MAG: NAD(P)-dependent oxidoreductase [Ruminococcaceae bacterium]|nr:NAD(P)-dependent oxidoreductase [Oscillospiraceae bacterium]